MSDSAPGRVLFITEMCLLLIATCDNQLASDGDGNFFSDERDLVRHVVRGNLCSQQKLQHK